MAIGDLLLELGIIADTALTETNKAIRSWFDGIGPQPQESDTWGPVGWFARPKDPVAEAEATPLSPAGACEAIAWNSPDAAQPMAFRDLRLSSQVSPDKGDVGMVGYGGGFITIEDNADGDGSTITLYALRKDSTGAADAAHVVTMDTTAAGSHIQITHESGATVQLHQDGGVYLSSSGDTSQSWLSLADGSDGLVVGAASTTIAGGVHLGANDPTDPALDRIPRWTNLNTWIIQVNTALSTLSAATGNLVPAITTPTATPNATINTKAK
ncbi:MAG: hypothetical protein ACPGVG_19815 [Mycobacterium sp.]